MRANMSHAEGSQLLLDLASNPALKTTLEDQSHLAHKLFPTVQVGGSKDVVSFNRLQQKVISDAGNAVRGVGGLGGAGGSQIRTETLARFCSP